MNQKDIMMNQCLFRRLCSEQPPSNCPTISLTIPKARKRLLEVMLTCFVLLGFGGECILAATIIQNCEEAELRAALQLGGEITFACDGNIVLTNTLLVSSHTTLNANGHDVSLDGNQSVRIMEVASNMTMRVQGIAFVRGMVAGAEGNSETPEGENVFGGAILNQGGHLHLTDCAFEENTASGGHAVPTSSVLNHRGGEACGGAIYSQKGSLHATNCLFAANRTLGGKGSLTASFLAGGAGGSARGGAIGATDCPLVMHQCIFEANKAEGGVGTGGSRPGYQGDGGDGIGGALHIENSTVLMTGCHFNACLAFGGISGDFDYRGNSGQSIAGACYLLEANSTILNARFSANVARSQIGTWKFGSVKPSLGGALVILDGTCDLRHAVFQTNQVVGGEVYRGNGSIAAGGAIYNTGQTAIENSLFHGNAIFGAYGGFEHTHAQGGAIHNLGQCHITKSQFTANKVIGGAALIDQGQDLRIPLTGHGQGGAVYNGNELTLSQSSFVANTAQGGESNFTRLDGVVPESGAGMGGALYNQSRLHATNVTFALNSVTGGDNLKYLAGHGLGGAFHNAAGTATLHHVTFDGNQAKRGRGLTNWVRIGIERIGDPVFGEAQGDTLFSTNGTTILSHTILNGGSTNGVCYGTVQDGGYNICSDASCNFTATGSLNETDPGLAGPEAHAGFPLWIPLLPDSMAVDAGSPSNCLAVDQRGVTRPRGDACDPGAYEWFDSWSIGGTIVGAGAENVLVEVGPFKALTDEQGHYLVDGLEDGTHEVHPIPTDETIIPARSTVLVGPDALSVDFRILAFNTLAAIRETNGINYFFKGSPQQEITLMSSTNLPNWQEERRMTLDATGLYQWMDQPSSEDLDRFYQVRSP